MIHKIVNSKIKDGKSVYGVIYKDDANKEIHYLTKDQINGSENGEELLSNFKKMRNEKKKIRSIEKIYGFVMPPDCEWLFAVRFKDSDKIDLVRRKELKKYDIDALLQFYESHINFLQDSKDAIIQKNKQSKKSHHSHSSSPHKQQQKPPK